MFTRNLVLVTLLTSSVALAQVRRSAADGPAPQDLESFVKFAPVILEATVESAFPSTQDSTTPRVTSDFMLRVDRVLKGSKPADRIVVHLPGGTIGTVQYETNQIPMLKPGEHYLFLLDPSIPPGMPDRSVPRYLIAATFRGMVKLEGNVTEWPAFQSPDWKKRYGELNPDQLRSRIQAIAGTSR